MAHDVFISYSSRDREAADAIVAALEGEGISCWIAPRDIQPGVEWSQAIVEAIRGSRLLLLIFTPHSNESPQVLREVERAVSLRVPLLPFRVQDAELTASMEYFISVAHWLIATTPPLQAHLPNLVMAVREQMAGSRRPEGGGGVPHPVGIAASAHTSVSLPAPLTGNLPSALTEIVGREAETVEVANLLGTTRLLTLTGAGGCGKSRLALEVAGAVSPQEYPDGAWLVEFGSLAEPELVEETVASALGVPEAGRMGEALRERRLLVVLDNCEHLLGTVAALAERLLKSCPHLRILATSREPFNLVVERTWRVPSLSLPDPRRSSTAAQVAQSAAVRFFAQRAQQRNPRFALTDANASVVAHICRRLDGIPLALELAAARVKALPVEQLSQRLDDQFRLLAGGGERTALPQHQTLRALMDWSFQLLNDPEKALLRRLSVFGGGCTLESAEAVCADGADGTVPEEAIETWEVLDYLSQLVDKSLVLMEEPAAEVGQPYTPPRYRMIETVRAYAREKLREAGEEGEWKRRHERYFRDVVVGATEGPPQTPTEQTEWQSRLLADRDNLRVALDNLLERAGEPEEGTEDAARVALGLIPFWARLGAHGEARGYLEKCLARESEIADASRRAHLRRALGWFAYLQGDHATAEALLARARELYREIGDAAGEATVLNHLALTAQAQGRLPEARESYGECLLLAREAGEERRAGDALSNLGLLHIEEANYDEARACLEEARAIFERMGDTMRTAGALCNLSNLALKEGGWAEARAYSAESLSLFSEIDHWLGKVFSLINLAESAAPLGDHTDALGYVRDALLLCQEAEMPQHIPLLLELAAMSQEATGDPEGALLSLEVARRLRQAGEMRGGGGDVVDAAEVAALAQRLAEALDPEQAARVRERAARTRPEEIFPLS